MLSGSHIVSYQCVKSFANVLSAVSCMLHMPRMSFARDLVGSGHFVILQDRDAANATGTRKCLGGTIGMVAVGSVGVLAVGPTPEWFQNNQSGSLHWIDAALGVANNWALIMKCTVMGYRRGGDGPGKRKMSTLR